MLDAPQPIKQLWAELEVMEQLATKPNDVERDHGTADDRLAGILWVLTDLVKPEHHAEVLEWAEKYVAAYDRVEKWYA